MNWYGIDLSIASPVIVSLLPLRVVEEAVGGARPYVIVSLLFRPEGEICGLPKGRLCFVTFTRPAPPQSSKAAELECFASRYVRLIDESKEPDLIAAFDQSEWKKFGLFTTEIREEDLVLFMTKGSAENFLADRARQALR